MLYRTTKTVLIGSICKKNDRRWSIIDADTNAIITARELGKVRVPRLLLYIPKR